MATNTLLVLASVLALALAEFNIAEIEPCPNNAQYCKVSQVRIDPCDTHAQKFCKLKKGLPATLEFDFTPYFNTTNLKTGVYWNDVAFAGMGSDDACLLTKCPTVAGQQQTYHYELYLGKKLPKGKYPMTWKVWNGEDQTQLCCFITTAKLVN